VPRSESAAARKIRGMLEDLRPSSAGSASAEARPELPLDRGEQRQEVRQIVEEVLKEMKEKKLTAGSGS
jgi:hypothetical protein